MVLSIIGGNGKPETVVVGEGNQFDPQTGQTSPLPPDMITELDQIFAALRTMYLGVVNFTFDSTRCHISPTWASRRQSFGFVLCNARSIVYQLKPEQP